jgi:predicted DNA-binding transcriptional regulator AlpA
MCCAYCVGTRSTIDKMVEDGELPPPHRFRSGSCVRFRLDDVDAAIQANNKCNVDDEFLARVKNADLKKTKRN